jgi:hypothetical protein
MRLRLVFLLLLVVFSVLSFAILTLQQPRNNLVACFGDVDVPNLLPIFNIPPVLHYIARFVVPFFLGCGSVCLKKTVYRNLGGVPPLDLGYLGGSSDVPYLGGF